MRIVVRLAGVCAALGAAALAQAQAYRCTGADGSVTLQQTPCAGTGTKLNVAPPPPPGSHVARAATAIAQRRVFVGMTEEEVLLSWGKPTNINRTLTERALSEQWVYDRGDVGRGQYVYLENGIVRSIQSSR